MGAQFIFMAQFELSIALLINNISEWSYCGYIAIIQWCNIKYKMPYKNTIPALSCTILLFCQNSYTLLKRKITLVLNYHISEDRNLQMVYLKKNKKPINGH